MYWRASHVPTATVTPAPLVYIKVVAVKKLIGLLYERPFTHKGNYLVCYIIICFEEWLVKKNAEAQGQNTGQSPVNVIFNASVLLCHSYFYCFICFSYLQLYTTSKKRV